MFQIIFGLIFPYNQTPKILLFLVLTQVNHLPLGHRIPRSLDRSLNCSIDLDRWIENCTGTKHVNLIRTARPLGASQFKFSSNAKEKSLQHKTQENKFLNVSFPHVIRFRVTSFGVVSVSFSSVLFCFQRKETKRKQEGNEKKTNS